MYGGVGWCYACVSCESGFCVNDRSRYLYNVIGGYLRILGAHNIQSCCTYWISASYRVFVYDRYRKSSIVYVWLSDMICLNITRFL